MMGVFMSGVIFRSCFITGDTPHCGFANKDCCRLRSCDVTMGCGLVYFLVFSSTDSCPIKVLLLFAIYIKMSQIMAVD